MRLAALVAVVALACNACAWIPHTHADALADMQEQANADAAHADAVEEFCRFRAGDCTDGMPHAGALPAYDEACGYLPPLLGDDC